MTVSLCDKLRNNRLEPAREDVEEHPLARSIRACSIAMVVGVSGTAHMACSSIGRY